MKKLFISILLAIAAFNLSFGDGENLMPSVIELGKTATAFTPLEPASPGAEVDGSIAMYVDGVLAGLVTPVTEIVITSSGQLLAWTFTPKYECDLILSTTHPSWPVQRCAQSKVVNLRDHSRTQVPIEIIVGETSTGFTFLDKQTAKTFTSVEAACSVFDATGDLASAISLSTSTLSMTNDTAILWTFSPTVTGTLILAATHPEWTVRQSAVGRVINPYTVQQATTYKLSTSISRSATWTVAAPIVRSSSSSYESVLEESLANDQGEIVKYHIVVYDQDTSIVNYFQAGHHYYVDNQTEVKSIFQRAVPDGDYSRYTYQQ